MTSKTHKKPTGNADNPQIPVYVKMCPDCGGYGGGCTACETCGGSGIVHMTPDERKVKEDRMDDSHTAHEPYPTAAMEKQWRSSMTQKSSQTCVTAEEIQSALRSADATRTAIMGNPSFWGCTLAAAYREVILALDELVRSEWMVTHDWGGDRDTVLHKCDAVLAKAKEATGEEG